MNKKELKKKLDRLNVFSGFYSLNGEQLPDRMVLDKTHNKWIVFYFDERGNREKEKKFSSESEACDYIYNHFKRTKKYN